MFSIYINVCLSADFLCFYCVCFCRSSVCVVYLLSTSPCVYSFSLLFYRFFFSAGWNYLDDASLFSVCKWGKGQRWKIERVLICLCVWVCLFEWGLSESVASISISSTPTFLLCVSVFPPFHLLPSPSLTLLLDSTALSLFFLHISVCLLGLCVYRFSSSVAFLYSMCSVDFRSVRVLVFDSPGCWLVLKLGFLC